MGKIANIYLGLAFNNEINGYTNNAVIIGTVPDGFESLLDTGMNFTGRLWTVSKQIMNPVSITIGADKKIYVDSYIPANRGFWVSMNYITR